MFLGWPSTNIAQTVPLGWTRWLPELKIEKPSNDFSSLTSGWIVIGNFLKNWRENSQNQVKHWSNLSQMFMSQRHPRPTAKLLFKTAKKKKSYQNSLYIWGILLIKQPASVVQLDALSDWRPGGRGFKPRWGRQHSFVEIDHEIFSTVILSLPLYTIRKQACTGLGWIFSNLNYWSLKLFILALASLRHQGFWYPTDKISLSLYY